MEAIGARAMKGVAVNLTAGLEARLGASGIARARTRAEVPLAEVMALLVRERITGLAPPECARTAVASWRAWIEERAGADLDRIEAAYRDQKSFARLTRSILKDLQMAENLGEDSESEGSESGEPEQQPQEQPDADAGKAEPTDAKESETESEDSDETSTEIRAEQTTSPSDDERNAGERQWRQEQPFSRQDEWGYRVFATQFDETVAATDLCPAAALMGVPPECRFRTPASARPSASDRTSQRYAGVFRLGARVVPIGIARGTR